MTSRIVDESGKYAPQVPNAVASDPIDPTELPQKQPDPYSHVDVHDFTNAATMSRVQLLTMSQIAYERGDTDTARRWKMIGVENVQRASNREAAEKMEQVFAPKYMPPPGQILEPRLNSPWGNDDEWQRLNSDYQKTQAELQGMSGAHPNFNELSSRAQTLAAKRDARQEEARESAVDAGVWSVQDDMVAAAHDSLAAKAKSVGDMFV